MQYHGPKGNRVEALLAQPKKKAEKCRDFLDWVCRRGCVTCGSAGEYHDNGEWLVDPSHIKTRKAGGSDIGNCVGMCRKCHVMLHNMGVNLFQRVMKKDLMRIARDYAELWERGQ